ncbi:MAG TPA: methyltransferase domain-containing protein [Armatimonadota bacterium]|nr:methyltransferase domain-containing protein [Armatimonadota bacterium]
MSEPSGNLRRFSGLAECYHAYRPQPPQILLEFLCRMALAERPRLVVDLGSGTGLSTQLWAALAESVVGIEPNEDMRRLAEGRTAAWNVSYKDAVGSATGLPDGAADIVSCSQSFHWMEPDSTLAEAARILRPGGVFGAFDCDWPPCVHPDVDALFGEVMERAHALEEERGISEDVRRWPKARHLGRIQATGLFRYAREVAFHQVEEGGAERLAGLVTSQGSTAALLRSGVSEAEIGLDRLREAARRVLGERTVPFYFTYRLRFGVK